METSKNTSELLKFRASNVVDTRMKIIKEAYLKKDFETFGRITMKDSNQFHATCLDTYPPIFYMNDTSSSVIRLVHAINKYYGKIVAAYTFDAGPNAVIYTLNEHVSTLLSVFSKFFPLTHDSSTLKDYCNKPVMYQDAIDNRSNAISNEFMSALEKTGIKGVVGQIKYCFVTRPGPGPVKQPLEECIIDLKTGEYKAPSEKHKRLNIGATPTEATAKNTCCGMKSCCDVSFRDQVIHHALVGIGIIAVLGYFYGKKCCRK